MYLLDNESQLTNSLTDCVNAHQFLFEPNKIWFKYFKIIIIIIKFITSASLLARKHRALSWWPWRAHHWLIGNFSHANKVHSAYREMALKNQRRTRGVKLKKIMNCNHFSWEKTIHNKLLINFRHNSQIDHWKISIEGSIPEIIGEISNVYGNSSTPEDRCGSAWN